MATCWLVIQILFWLGESEQRIEEMKAGGMGYALFLSIVPFSICAILLGVVGFKKKLRNVSQLFFIGVLFFSGALSVLFAQIGLCWLVDAVMLVTFIMVICFVVCPKLRRPEKYWSKVRSPSVLQILFWILFLIALAIAPVFIIKPLFPALS